MIPQKPDIVFLYTEIAEYFIAGCNILAGNKGKRVHIIRYPVNREAPFQFDKTGDGVQLYDRTNYSFEQLRELVNSIDPGLIFCSGWIDKDYLKLCRIYFAKIPTILTMDTHWRGDLKQHIASFVSPYYLLRRFSHAWVPGNAQKLYALKLGFREEKIRMGFYSCNTAHFNDLYHAILPGKESTYPKRFIYVGRYYEFKGVRNLWKAFIDLQNAEPNEWELWCLGTGTLLPAQHPKIRHFGFVQPGEFLKFAQETSVFVMPSLFEPWGVALHEFVTMGFPVLVSDRVGAAELFVKDGINGFRFEAESLHSLKGKLREIMCLSDEKLLCMSGESRRLSSQVTSEAWMSTVMDFYA